MVSRSQTVEQMLIEDDYSILYLSRSLKSSVEWLIENNLVFLHPLCPKCEVDQMSHVKDASKADQLKLLCRNKHCLSTKTFRWKTFFENHKLSLMELIQIVFYYFIKQASIQETIKHIPAEKSRIQNLFRTQKLNFSVYGRSEAMLSAWNYSSGR